MAIDDLAWYYRELRTVEDQRAAPARTWGSNLGSFTLEKLVREFCQNSYDAAIGQGPVQVVFRIRRIRRMLRDWKERFQYRALREHLAAAGHPIPKAIDGDGDEELMLLVSEDSRTTGLFGPEGARGTPYEAAIFGGRRTVKLNVHSSGSMGFGRYLLFEASGLGTLLFHSVFQPWKGAPGGSLLVGRCELGSHQLGETHYENGILGVRHAESAGAYRGEDSELANKLLIGRDPETPPGTTIAIVGYQSDRTDEDMVREIEDGVIQSFWPAMSLGRLKVSVEVWHDEDRKSERQISSSELVPNLHRAFLEATAAVSAPGPDSVAPLGEDRVRMCDVSVEIPPRNSVDDAEYGFDAGTAYQATDRAVAVRIDMANRAEAKQRGHILYMRHGRMILDARPFGGGIADDVAFLALVGLAAREGQANAAQDTLLRDSENHEHNGFNGALSEAREHYGKHAHTSLSIMAARIRGAIGSMLEPEASTDDRTDPDISQMFRTEDLGKEESGPNEEKKKKKKKKEGRRPTARCPASFEADPIMRVRMVRGGWIVEIKGVVKTIAPCAFWLGVRMAGETGEGAHFLEFDTLERVSRRGRRGDPAVSIDGGSSVEVVGAHEELFTFRVRATIGIARILSEAHVPAGAARARRRAVAALRKLALVGALKSRRDNNENEEEPQ